MSKLENNEIVFIDTNCLLKLLTVSEYKKDKYKEILYSCDKEGLSIYITQQVKDEFNRKKEDVLVATVSKNIEKIIAESNRTFSSLELLSNLIDISDLDSLREKITKLKNEYSQQIKQARDILFNKIKREELPGDEIIKEVLTMANLIEVDHSICLKARERADRGNPPDAQKSLGDAINWIALLQETPNKKMHLITNDSDFSSSLFENEPRLFLTDEWKREKNSELFLYKSIDNFIKEYLGINIEKDEEERTRKKENLLDTLELSSSFAATHVLIAELEKYERFSREEVKRILGIVESNNQVRWIVEDSDVHEFLRRVTKPYEKHEDIYNRYQKIKPYEDAGL